MKLCNLFKTWLEMLQRIAENELGVSNPSFSQYMEFRRKCLEFPVNVKVSPEIYLRKEYISVVNDIVRSLKSGNGISMYLSKRARELKKDGMFIHFGILHLHLNKKIGNRIVDIARNSGTTLQIYYSEGTVYIFNFGRHGRGAYTNINDVQKLYDVFPEALENRILCSDDNAANNLSSDDIYKARKSNGTTVVYIKDKDESTITLRPYLLTTLSNDDYILYQKLNEKFIELGNRLYKRGYRELVIKRDFENNEFIIMDSKNDMILYNFNNDDLINDIVKSFI